MNILFHCMQIGERGTEIATINYARGNVNVLKNNSYFCVPKGKIVSEEKYIEIKKEFKVFEYSSLSELKEIIENNKINLLYSQESGEDDYFGQLPIPVFIHAVFSLKNKHGNYYCPISSYLNKWYGKDYPVLPYIVHPFNYTNENLRKELNIPSDAVVFGGYGGSHNFSIEFAKDAVINTAKSNSKIYFLFANFDNFCEERNINLPNVIFLPCIIDMKEKEKFINTCDAMLHARRDGETFGLAVAEFSIKNKPVITWKLQKRYYFRNLVKKILKMRSEYETSHLDNLGDAAIIYKNYKQLYDILNHFNKYTKVGFNYDKFSEPFSEKKIMEIFNSIITNEKVN